jgi:hypothetical protein
VEVESPLPFELVFLSLALPSVWFAGRLLARRAARDPGIQAVIAPGIGVALWIAGPPARSRSGSSPGRWAWRWWRSPAWPASAR